MSDIQASFQGEMQLAGWSETHNGGCKVTFWLPDASELEAFRALTVRKGNTAGHRFMAAMVEIGDDEQPVQTPESPQDASEPCKGGALAKLAGMLCQDVEFRVFMNAQGWAGGSAESAAESIRTLCAIKSRAELDNDADAAAVFHRVIRGPYIKWRASRGLN